MKKIFIMCLIALGFILTSCSKEENVADKFVGKYTVYCNSIGYGSTHLINVDSLLTISKISENEILASGYFNTYGFIDENDSVFFNHMRYNGSQEESSITFTNGALNGNILTFDAVWHYMYGSNVSGFWNGGTRNLHFTAYKN